MNLKKDFKCITKDNLTYLIVNKWEEDKKLIHCFTTRSGGVSTGYLSSLNLGFNRGDARENVIQNYQKVCDVLDIKLSSLVLSKQVHEVNIIKVNKDDAGNGIYYENKWESIDGIYTAEKDITLVTHYADCVPLLFYAPDYSIIGMAHAGWRGTVKEIGKVLVEKWKTSENIPASHIQVAIGPSIGKCCFEVDEEVAKEFVSQFGDKPFIQYYPKEKKYHIDLWEANKYSLLRAGIKEENLVISGFCTSCNDDLFFSHRKSNGKRGTMGAFMALKSLGDEAFEL
jgi:YfiH family protein